MSDTLPPGWRIANVRDMAGHDGIVTDGDWVESKDQDPAGEVRLIQLADVGDGAFLDRSSRFMTMEAARRLQCTFLRPDDVLIARMPHPLGRACIFPGLNRPAVTAVDVLVWRSGDGAVDARWLMHTINSPDVRRRLSDFAGGTTRQRVSGGNVKRLEMPVPPLAEQRRIVARIEALFARTRRARADLERIAPLSSTYRQKVLEQTFTAAAGDSESVPLGPLLTAIEAGKNMRCDERRPRPGENGIVKISAVTWGHFDPAAIKTAPADAVLDPRSRIANGDFLMSRANTLELVGAPVIAQNVPADTFLSDKVLRLRFREPVERWVLWFLRSPLGRREIEGRSSGNQLSMRNIGQGALREIPVPMPDAEIRMRATAAIESGEERIALADREATRALALLDRLEQSILARAFRGELVPHETDPAADKVSENSQPFKVPRVEKRCGRVAA